MSTGDTSSHKTALLAKINNHTATVGVIGLGYVGLPLAVEKAKVGYQVIGLDENSHRVAKINRGDNYIADVKTEELQTLVNSGHIRAYSEYSRVPDMDIIIIAVPTPLTKNLTPDLQYVENVSRSIAPLLRPGQLISLESTTYPGTTEEVMLPILEKSGLTLNTDFFLTHSPERVDPGNKRYTTKNINKVVGGVGAESQEIGVAFYSQTIEKVVPVSSAKAAELVKVFENTFRAVNIALVNELTLLCDRMNLNIWEVLDAAFTKPFGIMPFYPGPGVGGHCIPLDPHYLEWKAKEVNFSTHFIALAGEINRQMPEFVLEKTQRVLDSTGVVLSKSKILVMGVSYKRDLDDWRESPSLDVIRLLRKRKADVMYHDPYVPFFDEHELDMKCTPLTDGLLESVDLVLILTDHSNIEYSHIVSKAKVVFDTRNATRNVRENRSKITLL